MHDGYASTSHSSPYLHSVTTPVQCTYIPVSDLRDVFGIYQWPIQLGGVLLAFAPIYQGVTPIDNCEDRPQCSLDKGNFLRFWFL